MTGVDMMTVCRGLPLRDLGKARAYLIWYDRQYDDRAYPWIVDGFTGGQGFDDAEARAADVCFVIEALELAHMCQIIRRDDVSARVISDLGSHPAAMN